MDDSGDAKHPLLIVVATQVDRRAISSIACNRADSYLKNRLQSRKLVRSIAALSHLDGVEKSLFELVAIVRSGMRQSILPQQRDRYGHHTHRNTLFSVRSALKWRNHGRFCHC